MVYVLKADGQCEPLAESEVREKLIRGLLQPETYFWKEGMPEWLPLSQLAPSQLALHSNTPVETTVAPPRRGQATSPTFSPAAGKSVSPQSLEYEWRPAQNVQPVPVHTYYAREDLEPLTTILLVMLGICLVSGVICLYFDVGQYLLLQHDFTDEEAKANDHLVFMAGHIAQLIFLITAIPFLMWVYRVSQNCRGFVHDMTFTSRWAVGSFFVPIMNLFRPCQAMQEIWKVSTNPVSWSYENASVLVGIWWTLWLGYVVIGRVASQMAYGAHERAALIQLTELYISDRIIYFFLCLVAGLLVFTISAKQKRLLEAE